PMPGTTRLTACNAATNAARRSSTPTSTSPTRSSSCVASCGTRDQPPLGHPTRQTAMIYINPRDLLVQEEPPEGTAHGATLAPVFGAVACAAGAAVTSGAVVLVGVAGVA